MTRYLPVIWIVLATAGIFVAVVSWWRWEPALIIVALVLAATGMFTDPDRGRPSDDDG